MHLIIGGSGRVVRSPCPKGTTTSPGWWSRRSASGSEGRASLAHRLTELAVSPEGAGGLRVNRLTLPDDWRSIAAQRLRACNSWTRNSARAWNSAGVLLGKWWEASLGWPRKADEGRELPRASLAQRRQLGVLTREVATR